MSTDPIVRAVAGGILVMAFAACLAVAVHGFWLNPDYQLPDLLAWVLGSAVTAATTLLGVHVGSLGTVRAVNQGAAVRNGDPVVKS